MDIFIGWRPLLIFNSAFHILHFTFLHFHFLQFTSERRNSRKCSTSTCGSFFGKATAERYVGGSRNTTEECSSCQVLYVCVSTVFFGIHICVWTLVFGICLSRHWFDKYFTSGIGCRFLNSRTTTFSFRSHTSQRINNYVATMWHFQTAQSSSVTSEWECCGAKIKQAASDSLLYICVSNQCRLLAWIMEVDVMSFYVILWYVTLCYDVLCCVTNLYQEYLTIICCHNDMH